MSDKKHGSVPFRPYARLISILGDQLISDKWIGVIELVKNSYDADANTVDIRFKDFNEDGFPQTIEIEDDGSGMDKDDVLEKWMNPATPNKLNSKKGKIRFTKKKRIMQGDKGVGRFAIYKLGNYVELFTKSHKKEEVQLTLDFKLYADDSFEKSKHEDLFLDQIKNSWKLNDIPTEITRRNGTLIRIKNLRDNWSESDLKKLSKAFFRMMPPSLPGQNRIEDFKTNIFWNEEEYISDDYSLGDLLNVRPYYFEGSIDESGNLNCTYSHNTKKTEISFNVFDLTNEKMIKYDLLKFKPFKERFIRKVKNEIELRKEPSNVGSFMFFYYGYDLGDPNLSAVERTKLKESSVYLFRDNVRVFPYGEIGDDWLGFSKLRGEQRASEIFSYNDLIGFVFITQDENSLLRDAADREGLMNEKGCRDDFIALVSSSLKVMKYEVDTDKQKAKNRKEKASKIIQKEYENAYTQLESSIVKGDASQEQILKKATNLLNASDQLVKKSKHNLLVTTELAGTGMAIEKATHDTMTLLRNLKRNTKALTKKVEKGEVDNMVVVEFLKDMTESLEFIYQELTVLSPLFRKARKYTTDVSIKDVALRVKKFFPKDFKTIDFVIIGEDFTVRTNTGLVLQVMLNLMDNSIYWLKQTKKINKLIQLHLDKDERNFVISDNGPGIDKKQRDIIFNEFHSTKSGGRGLGLFIARELLSKIDGEISVYEENHLEGANIKVQF